MTALGFVDTSVLIYAHDADAGQKRTIASRLLRELWETGSGCLSSQVLQEFYVNVTRKIRSPVTVGAAREVIRTYAQWVRVPSSAETILRASEISEVWRLSFWDSMICASCDPSRRCFWVWWVLGIGTWGSLH